LNPEELSRRDVLGLLGLGSATALAGCGGQTGDGGGGGGGDGGDGGSDASGDGKIEANFVSGLQKEPDQYQYNNYNPNRSAFGDESIAEAFWAPIIEYHPGKNEFVSDLAESWDFSQGESFTVTLREGIQWWDGTPVTADDLVAQKRMDRPVYGSDTGMWKWTSEVRAEDDRTVTAVLDSDVNPLIYTETAWHQDPLFVKRGLFEGYIERLEGATSDSETESVTQDLLEDSFDEPIGYGAWQIDEVSSEELIATPWENYWAYDAINWTQRTFIPTFWETRPQVQKQSMVGNELDGSPTITGGITEEFMNRVPGDPIFPKVPTFNGFGIDINHSVTSFDDARVRKAMAYATDHEKMASIDAGHEQVQSKFTQMSNYYYEDYLSDEVLNGLVDYGPQDLDAAEALLEEAELTMEDGQRMLPDGSPFTTTLKTIGGRVPWAQIFKENMDSLGINVEITTVENSRFFGTAVPNGDFEIALWTASGWKRHHPQGDFSLTWIPSSSPWAKGSRIDLTPEVPWPPGDVNNDLQKVDIESRVSELGRVQGDREVELVNELGWIANQTMPNIRLTERHLVAMIQTDDWDVASVDDPDSKVPNPLNWMPKVGKLGAKD